MYLFIDFLGNRSNLYQKQSRIADKERHRLNITGKDLWQVWGQSEARPVKLNIRTKTFF